MQKTNYPYDISPDRKYTQDNDPTIKKFDDIQDAWKIEAKYLETMVRNMNRIEMLNLMATDPDGTGIIADIFEYEYANASENDKTHPWQFLNWVIDINDDKVLSLKCNLPLKTGFGIALKRLLAKDPKKYAHIIIPEKFPWLDFAEPNQDIA